MRGLLLKSCMAATCVLFALTSSVSAQIIVEENVSGGVLDLSWSPAFGLPNNVTAKTLLAGDPGYNNPSGDHTVASLENSDPSMGGLGKSLTDSQGFSDYLWEGYVFTGDGSTRRGLIVRADPDNAFTTCYQFIIDFGLLQLKFRKLAGMGATELGNWFTTSTPSGLPGQNEWHHMAVQAIGSSFRVWWDGYELTQGTPIVDSDLETGWVGVYNFRFDLGGVEVLYDDLQLSVQTVPVKETTWGKVKAMYAQ